MQTKTKKDRKRDGRRDARIYYKTNEEEKTDLKACCLYQIDRYTLIVFDIGSATKLSS